MGMKKASNCAMFFWKCAMSVPRLEKKKGPHRCKPYSIWWPPCESNTAPTDYESAALTKHELGGQNFYSRYFKLRVEINTS